MPISNKTSIAVLGVAHTGFAFAVPLAITFTTYFTVETATAVSGRLLGVVIAIITAFAWAGSIKKKIKLRREQGFAPQPYSVLFANSVMPLTAIIGITTLLFKLQGEISELANVMAVISASEVVAFGMKNWQTHFEIKEMKQLPTPPQQNII